jgi:D-alanyl-D-alanine carboxypeptidase
VLLGATPAGASASAPSTTAPGPPPAKAELLADLDTGRVLVEQNDHIPLPPASLTKILTAVVAADWLPPDSQVPVSARAANVAPDKLGMKTGQVWSFDIAMHALLISSSNDAAYALAELASGSVENFSATMVTAAQQMGMEDHPVLRDPAGLDGSEGVDGGNLMSAWDIAVAARNLMANPYLAGMVAEKSFRFTGPDGIVYDIASHNRAFLNSYPGAIGVKTGYTVPAGVCIAAEAVRGGRHMLAVVMNGESPDRTAEMLLDEGFATDPRAEPEQAPMLPPVSEPRPAAPEAKHDPARGGSTVHASPLPSAYAADRLAAVDSTKTTSILPPALAAASLVMLVASALTLVARGRRRQREMGLHYRRRR